MSATPDFYTRATEQLRTMAGDDTVVIGTLNGERMHLQTRAPRGPAELVHIARRLLEEARDQYAEAATEATDAAAIDRAVDCGDSLDEAISLLPDLSAAAEEG